MQICEDSGDAFGACMCDEDTGSSGDTGTPSDSYDPDDDNDPDSDGTATETSDTSSTESTTSDTDPSDTNDSSDATTTNSEGDSSDDLSSDPSETSDGSDDQTDDSSSNTPTDSSTTDDSDSSNETAECIDDQDCGTDNACQSWACEAGSCIETPLQPQVVAELHIDEQSPIRDDLQGLCGAWIAGPTTTLEVMGCGDESVVQMACRVTVEGIRARIEIEGPDCDASQFESDLTLASCVMVEASGLPAGSASLRAQCCIQAPASQSSR